MHEAWTDRWSTSSHSASICFCLWRMAGMCLSPNIKIISAAVAIQYPSHIAVPRASKMTRHTNPAYMMRCASKSLYLSNSSRILDPMHHCDGGAALGSLRRFNTENLSAVGSLSAKNERLRLFFRTMKP